MPQVSGLADILELDSLLLYRLKPGLQGVPLSGEVLGSPVDFRVTTNSLGL